MPVALSFQSVAAFFVCAFGAGAGWALGTWLIHRLLGH